MRRAFVSQYYDMCGHGFWPDITICSVAESVHDSSKAFSQNICLAQYSKLSSEYMMKTSAKNCFEHCITVLSHVWLMKRYHGLFSGRRYKSKAFSKKGLITCVWASTQRSLSSEWWKLPKKMRWAFVSQYYHVFGLWPDITIFTDRKCTWFIKGFFTKNIWITCVLASTQRSVAND